MRFSVLVNCHPDSAAAEHTLAFCRAVVSGGHELYRVFFVAEGVLHGSEPSAPHLKDWQGLITDGQCDAVCCANSVSTYLPGHDQQALAQGFGVGGMGLLVQASVDEGAQLITFGQRREHDH